MLPENEDDFLDKEPDREVRRTSRKHRRHRLGGGCRDGPEISISSSDESKAEKEEDHLVQERYVTKIKIEGMERARKLDRCDSGQNRER